MFVGESFVLGQSDAAGSAESVAFSSTAAPCCHEAAALHVGAACMELMCLLVCLVGRPSSPREVATP